MPESSMFYVSFLFVAYLSLFLTIMVDQPERIIDQVMGIFAFIFWTLFPSV